MLNILRRLNPLALGVALFVCYILPIIIAWLCIVAIMNFLPNPEIHIGWVGFLLFSSLFLCPFISGYFVASLAKQVPLLHGLATSLLASIIYFAIFSLTGQFSAWFIVGVLFLILSCLSGAWLWRYHTGKVYEL